MWGTAGMIARSQFLKTPYLGHPSRGRLIDLSNFAPGRTSAQDVINRFVTTERIKLFDRVTAGQKTRAVSLSLPPLALEVIAESRDASQLIPTAIQLREKYRKLREWIAQYQLALELNPADAAKQTASLEAAAADIDRLFSGSWWAKLTVEFSLNLIFTLLRIHEKLGPQICLDGAAPIDALWVLAQEVVLPTAHLIFTLRQAAGLGTEFRRDSTWYVPQEIDGKFMQPVSVLLDRWLRTAGFRTAYGVSKPKGSDLSDDAEMKWATQRRQVKRWLDGKSFPKLENLHALVDSFPEKVDWLDTAESWRARFTLAFLIGRALRESDQFFTGRVKASSSAQLAKGFHAMSQEPIWTDDEGLLVQPSSFFAVRLWLRHLATTGDLDALLEKAPKEVKMNFGPDATDEEIQEAKLSVNRTLNFGNHLAQHLLNAAGASNDVSSPFAVFARNQQVEDFLLKYAAGELNRLIALAAKKPGDSSCFARVMS